MKHIIQYTIIPRYINSVEVELDFKMKIELPEDIQSDILRDEEKQQFALQSNSKLPVKRITTHIICHNIQEVKSTFNKYNKLEEPDWDWVPDYICNILSFIATCREYRLITKPATEKYYNSLIIYLEELMGEDLYEVLGVEPDEPIEYNLLNVFDEPQNEIIIK